MSRRRPRNDEQFHADFARLFGASYVPRAEQVRVMDTLSCLPLLNHIHVVEAPCGIGKTPVAMWQIDQALQKTEAKRAVYMCSTTNLQTQLVEDCVYKWKMNDLIFCIFGKNRYACEKRARALISGVYPVPDPVRRYLETTILDRPPQERTADYWMRPLREDFLEYCAAAEVDNPEQWWRLVS